MGSFRSQPDLTIHSVEKKGNALTYASSHMCGTILSTFRLENLHVRRPHFGFASC
jgi:hypothetical protein